MVVVYLESNNKINRPSRQWDLWYVAFLWIVLFYCDVISVCTTCVLSNTEQLTLECTALSLTLYASLENSPLLDWNVRSTAHFELKQSGIIYSHDSEIARSYQNKTKFQNQYFELVQELNIRQNYSSLRHKTDKIHIKYCFSHFVHLWTTNHLSMQSAKSSEAQSEHFVTYYRGSLCFESNG